jgi:hypothetical protein
LDYFLVVPSPKTEENGVVNSDATTAEESNGVGQSGVQDDVSNPNVVQVAVSSKDHTTLVAAVKSG